MTRESSTGGGGKGPRMMKSGNYFSSRAPCPLIGDVEMRKLPEASCWGLQLTTSYATSCWWDHDDKQWSDGKHDGWKNSRRACCLWQAKGKFFCLEANVRAPLRLSNIHSQLCSLSCMMDFKMWICIWFASHCHDLTLCRSSITTVWPLWWLSFSPSFFNLTLHCTEIIEW